MVHKFKIGDGVTYSYLDAIEFTDCGPDSEFPKDSSFSQELMDQAWADCRDFIQAVEASDIDVSEWDDEQLGHDFWLTRNGHGAGFWDRDLPDGDRLTQLAHAFGEVWTYDGGDGLIYMTA